MVPSLFSTFKSTQISNSSEVRFEMGGWSAKNVGKNSYGYFSNSFIMKSFQPPNLRQHPRFYRITMLHLLEIIFIFSSKMKNLCRHFSIELYADQITEYY